MPPLDLVHNIPLRSPTLIMGTPFDVTVNYEYPFPLDHPPSTVPTISSPTMQLPSASSQHLLSSSLPPHVAKSISPPPISGSYSHSLTHPKMQSPEPPIPPGIITRRQMSKARSASNDSIRSGDANENVSSISCRSATLSSVDLLLEQNRQGSPLGRRERKKN